MGLLFLLLLTQSVKFKVADTLFGLSDSDLSVANCQFTANIYVFPSFFENFGASSNMAENIFSPPQFGDSVTIHA